MILVIHPTGNQCARALLRGLRDHRLLAEYATTVAINRGAPWLRLVPAGPRQELLRRSYGDVAGIRIRTRPLRELVRFGAHRLGLRRLTGPDTGCASVHAVYKDLDDHTARILPRLAGELGLSGVYAYEDGALATFRVARRLGLRCLYDQQIGHWQTARLILREEAALQPDWAPTLDFGNRTGPDILARRDEELALSDDIFAASSFTRTTLGEAGIEARRIHVIPYGGPASTSDAVCASRGTGPRLRVLFVGSLGQRKGTSYLLEAVRLLGPEAVELTLIGNPGGAPCAPLRRALAEHRHIPSLPHSGILDEMRRHDVFVFPSLFEGFGLVLLEAMSQGLPVITTPNTGGPDILTDGTDGYLVPIRSPEAIAAKLELLHRDRGLLRQMAAAALATARRYPWTRYEASMVSAIRACAPPANESCTASR